MPQRKSEPNPNQIGPFWQIYGPQMHRPWNSIWNHNKCLSKKNDDNTVYTIVGSLGGINIPCAKAKGVGVMRPPPQIRS